MKKINSLKSLKQINKSLACIIADDIIETDDDSSESDDDLMQGQIKTNTKKISVLISQNQKLINNKIIKTIDQVQVKRAQVKLIKSSMYL